jgi:hypothetical protein
VLKSIPLLVKKEDAKPFVDRLVGPYMGKTKGKGESFPWILDHLRDGNGKVSPRSLVISQVPWESRRMIELALKANWDAWSAQNPEQRPPADTPRELVDVLLELGIVRDRGGDKYDVPDLYLHGLGLKRKGGVSKGTRPPPR